MLVLLTSIPLLLACPNPPSNKPLIKVTVPSLGTPGFYSCAAPMQGSACESNWRPILEDQAQNPHCTLTCLKNSECPGTGSSCHLGTKGLTVAQVGICLYQQDMTSGGAVSALSLIAAPKQQVLDPHSALHGLPSHNHFSFLVGSLSQTLDKLQTQKNLNGDPDMLAVRLLVAELVKVGKAGAAFGTGGGVLGAVEYGADVTIHNFLHPVEFMVHGTPGALWDISHPFKSRSAFIVLRGLLILAMLYLGIGAIVNVYLYNATGLAMVPHLAFWAEYPELVADGWWVVRNKVELVQAKINEGARLGNRDSRYLGVRDSFSNFDPLQ